MSVGFKRECPRCYTDRTMLDTSFAIPGYVDPHAKQKNDDDCINAACVLPVRLVLCPRCHLLEIYHDVGQAR